MFVLIAVVAVLFALYATWRVKYGMPPGDVPSVLCFHKISRKFCWEGTWTTPKRFFAYIGHLRASGYEFLTENDYLDALGDPHPGHANKLLLTFDDGYEELHGLVFPGLRERGVPFHVFLISEYVGKLNSWELSLGRRPFRHLTWEQIGEMAAAGVTFGSHTATHVDLTRVGEKRVRTELTESKRILESKLGLRVRSLSYPFGRYNDSVKRIVREAGYDAGFSLYPRHVNERVDRFALRRNGVYIIDPVRGLTMKLRGGPLFWFEEMKCRAINAVAALTPMFKRGT